MPTMSENSESEAPSGTEAGAVADDAGGPSARGDRSSAGARRRGGPGAVGTGGSAGSPGSGGRGGDEGPRHPGGAVRRVRDLLASAVLTVAALAAGILALGAVLTTLGANPENVIVQTVRDWGGQLDGPFANLFTFPGEPGKQLLVNWGIAALAYLVLGRIAERVLRP